MKFGGQNPIKILSHNMPMEKYLNVFHFECTGGISPATSTFCHIKPLSLAHVKLDLMTSDLSFKLFEVKRRYRYFC